MDTERTAELSRHTKETRIEGKLVVDGRGRSEIETGIPFFDHLLTLFAGHALVDLELRAQGDVEVDYHHTVEDCGIVLGSLFRSALGEKHGMVRYGFFLLPMDETLARAAVDFSGRSFLVYRAEVPHPYVRDFNIHLMREFYQAFANQAGANLHLLHEYGEEPHHVAEALVKGFARAVGTAVGFDPRVEGRAWSTKGEL